MCPERSDALLCPSCLPKPCLVRRGEGMVSKLMAASDPSEQRLIQETAMTLMRSH